MLWIVYWFFDSSSWGSPCFCMFFSYFGEVFIYDLIRDTVMTFDLGFFYLIAALIKRFYLSSHLTYPALSFLMLLKHFSSSLLIHLDPLLCLQVLIAYLLLSFQNTEFFNFFLISACDLFNVFISSLNSVFKSCFIFVILFNSIFITWCLNNSQYQDSDIRMQRWRPAGSSSYIMNPNTPVLCVFTSLVTKVMMFLCRWETMVFQMSHLGIQQVNRPHCKIKIKCINPNLKLKCNSKMKYEYEWIFKE